MSRSLSNILVGVLLVLIAGCGFHLRGSTTLPNNLKTMYLQGINVQQGLGLDLKGGLVSNGVTVLDSYQQGSAVLTILNNDYERRVLSVGSNATVSEYQLYGVLTFKLTGENNQLLIEADKVEAVRDYQFNQNQVLGSDQEEVQLRQELNEQLVQSILRRLSVLK